MRKRDIPPEACRLVSDQPVAMLAAKEDDSAQPGGEKPKRFRMEPLISGNVIRNHWYWGNLAIDLEGIEIPKRPVAALLDHDPSKRVGVIEHGSLEKGLGLVVEGRFLSASESAVQVLADAADGFPWEASARAIPLDIQELTPGQTETVNGQEITGPGAIFRRTRIGEGSFVAVGADPDTSARAISARQEGQAMADDDKTTSPKTPPAVQPVAPELTADLIRREHPTINADLEASGAKSERRRVLEILDFSEPSQLDLALAMIRDGTELAAAQRKLNQDLRERFARATDQSVGPVQKPAAQAPPREDDVSDDALKARWAGDAQLRDKFVEFEIFAAWQRREVKGLHRVTGARGA